jgi:hypothetical protein
LRWSKLHLRLSASGCEILHLRTELCLRRCLQVLELRE